MKVLSIEIFIFEMSTGDGVGEGVGIGVAAGAWAMVPPQATVRMPNAIASSVDLDAFKVCLRGDRGANGTGGFVAQPASNRDE
jgi:hypothetical protein